jgi:hypothetical protein
METENKIPLDDRPSATYTKKCGKCGVVKPRSEFYTEKSVKDGLRRTCKVCHRAYNNNPEQQEKSKLRNREQRKNDPRKNMWYRARSRAKAFDVPFTITVEDIYIPKFCPILGIELKLGIMYNTENSPTLDRVIPELGYVPGNIGVISFRANRLKSSATVEELEAMIKYIKSYSHIELKSIVENKVEPISQTPKYGRVNI